MAQRLQPRIVDVLKNYLIRDERDSMNRFRSWVYCFKAFEDNTLDTNTLALNLGFYLASWGMYRGSGFLLQKDYTIHIPIVEALREPLYAPLKSIGAEEIKARAAQIIELRERLRKIYIAQLQSSDNVNGLREDARPSDVLITKILLGTLGCVPAHDRYLRAGALESGIVIGQLTKRSIVSCCDFYERHSQEFRAAEALLTSRGLNFPPMKIVDTYWWEVGFKSLQKKAALLRTK